MALNQTPASERIHIAFFGRRNAGKSSVMNAVTGQNMAVVSDVKGTTTDPVYKTMELLPLGPVMIIDTPGIDDEGELGALRVKKSRQVLNKTDVAVLVVDAKEGMAEADQELLDLIQKKNLAYLIVYNKMDLLKPEEINELEKVDPEHSMLVSALNGSGIHELKEKIGTLRPQDEEKDLLEGLVNPGDTVVLVVPIDKAAPKGRLILPQQQTIRALLDKGCMAMVVRDTELEEALANMPKKPALVITDSQAFGKVSKIVPEDVKLTSFSILFARYKGNLRQAVEGVMALHELKDHDKVLLSEGCTHHRQCGDIGTVKLPNWIRTFTGKEIEFVWSAGTEFPENLNEYQLIVHCGACMLNEREMKYRLACAKDQSVPMTNYGILIAYVHGILKRSIAPIPEMTDLLFCCGSMVYDFNTCIVN